MRVNQHLKIQLPFFLERSWRDSKILILCCDLAGPPQGATFLKLLEEPGQESGLSEPVQGTGDLCGRPGSLDHLLWSSRTPAEGRRRER